MPYHLHHETYPMASNYLCHMQFRIATTADTAILDGFVNSAYRGESSKKGWTTEADLLDGIRTSEDALKKMIQNPSAVILIAEENSAVKGCVYLEHKGDALYLGMLTVKPEQQGQGLGAQLMQKAEERARDLGCRKIQMTVITARDSLIAYYKRKGYRDTGERSPFPNDPAFGIPKQPLLFMLMEKLLL